MDENVSLGGSHHGQDAAVHGLTAEEVLRLPRYNWASRVTVGAVICNASGHEILVLRRRADQEYGGIEELPSGKTEQGETVAAAVKREVLEETGLQVVSVDELLFVFDYESRRGKAVQLNFRVEVSGLASIVLDTGEHSSYRWLPWVALESSGLTTNVIDALRRAR